MILFRNVHTHLQRNATKHSSLIINEKCSTSFMKNCKITYQPMAFDEKVEICDEPLKKICNDKIVGEEVCRTVYETSCEISGRIYFKITILI